LVSAENSTLLGDVPVLTTALSARAPGLLYSVMLVSLRTSATMYQLAADG
jgi:hypothetical protein